VLNFAKSHRAALSLVLLVSAAIHLVLSYAPLPAPFHALSIVSSWPWSWVVVTLGDSALWSLSFPAARVVLNVIFAAGFAVNVTLIVLTAWYWSSHRAPRVMTQ
jgi:hypothetical protein